MPMKSQRGKQAALSLEEILKKEILRKLAVILAATEDMKDASTREMIQVACLDTSSAVLELLALCEQTHGEKSTTGKDKQTFH